MPSIRKSLLQFVFSGAYMKRWNDKLRPVELMEVDKQAHKMSPPRNGCALAPKWWKAGCSTTSTAWSLLT